MVLYEKQFSCNVTPEVNVHVNVHSDGVTVNSMLTELRHHTITNMVKQRGYTAVMFVAIKPRM